MARMSRVGLSPAEEKRSGTASQAARRRNMKKGGKAKANVDDFSGMALAEFDKESRASLKMHRDKDRKMKKLIETGMIKKNPTARDLDDFLASLMPESIKIPQSRELEPDSELWGRSTPEKIKRIRARNKKKAAKKKSGGTAKLAVGGQGYTAREDESLGMRTGPERSKAQSMAARRDESYGDWGKRRRGRVNVKKGGSIGAALRGGGAVVR